MRLAVESGVQLAETMKNNMMQSKAGGVKDKDQGNSSNKQPSGERYMDKRVETLCLVKKEGLCYTMLSSIS